MSRRHRPPSHSHKKGQDTRRLSDKLHFPEDVQKVVLELLAELGRLEHGATLKLEDVLEELKRRDRISRGLVETSPMPLPNAKRSARVRLQLVIEGSRLAKKALVVNRSAGIESLLLKAKHTLKTKRTPKFVYVAETGVELHDLESVEDGDTICVGDTEPRKSHQQPEEATTAVSIGSREAWEEEGAALEPMKVEDKPRRVERTHKPHAPAISQSSVFADAMLAERSKLPAYIMRETIVSAIRGAAVTVIAGATGCGKSTQIPQLVLEDCDARQLASSTKIVVTQPRRLAAVALAERVARESMTGPKDVGYTVRLDSKNSSTARIEFCTVGVLLRRLQQGRAYVDGVSHIIVDEAHERDALTDFLLILLKRSIRASPKLIIMSATLDADLFVSYFNSPSSDDHEIVKVVIPGRVYPVEELFVDQVNRRLSTQYKPNEDHRQCEDEPSSLSPPANRSLDCEQVARVVVAVSALRRGDEKTTRGGAVLVFAPGAAEIDKICRAVRSKDDALTVLPLHATLSAGQQRRVFEARAGKIIVATNVAETSITIDDVTDVVDTGRLKEVRYRCGVSKLAEVWVSKAAARQRAGRAGRCSAGIVWRLYSRDFYRQCLPDFAAPELVRTPLEEVVLRVLRLGHQPEKLLREAMEPPPESAVAQAIASLCDVGAVVSTRAGGPEVSIDDEEDLFSFAEYKAAGDDEEPEWKLTSMGYHISNLPVNCRLAKLLILGCLFGCIETTLTIAAALSASKDVFYSPPLHLRKQAAAAKRQLAAGEDSDVLAVVSAYTKWRRTEDRRQFCAQYFVSSAALNEVHQLRDYLRTTLRECGWQTGDTATDDDVYSLSIVRGLLCASLHLAVQGARKQGAGKGPLAGRDTTSRWYCHPASVNFDRLRGCEGRQYVVYNASLHTSKPYLMDTSLVNAISVLLFAGGGLYPTIDGQAIVLDRWLPFRTTTNGALVVAALRREVEALILRFVMLRAHDRREEAGGDAAAAAAADVVIDGARSESMGDGAQEVEGRLVSSEKEEERAQLLARPVVSAVRNVLALLTSRRA